MIGPTMAVAVDYIRRLEGFKHLHRDCGERIDGLRDECRQLRRDIATAEDARDAALLRADMLADENDELRRQLPDYDDGALVRRMQ